ncbi:MAG: hypothetical protein AB1403_05165 [Candidatus Riflebacteria bacterium]
MLENPGFFFFHFLARIFGSIFFPLFEAYGENEFKSRAGRVVFARYEGFISVLNILRFFKTPVRFVLRREDCDKFSWHLLVAGGINVSQVEDEATVVEIIEKISISNNEKETPVYFISNGFEDRDNELIKRLEPEKVLFLAVTAKEKKFSAGIIPIVQDTKALCAAPPVFTSDQAEFTGLQILAFLEKSLALTPQFELPTFFYNHQKFTRN